MMVIYTTYLTTLGAARDTTSLMLAYNAYSGSLKKLPIRFGDPAMNLPVSSTVLNGVNPIRRCLCPSMS